MFKLLIIPLFYLYFSSANASVLEKCFLNPSSCNLNVDSQSNQNTNQPSSSKKVELSNSNDKAEISNSNLTPRVRTWKKATSVEEAQRFANEMQASTSK